MSTVWPRRKRVAAWRTIKYSAASNKQEQVKQGVEWEKGVTVSQSTMNQREKQTEDWIGMVAIERLRTMKANRSMVRAVQYRQSEIAIKASCDVKVLTQRKVFEKQSSRSHFSTTIWELYKDWTKVKYAVHLRRCGRLKNKKGPVRSLRLVAHQRRRMASAAGKRRLMRRNSKTFHGGCGTRQQEHGRSCVRSTGNDGQHKIQPSEGMPHHTEGRQT